MINKHEWFNNLISKKKDLLVGLSKLYPILDIEPIKTESWNGIFKTTGSQGDFCLKVINDSTTNIPRSNSDLMVMCQYISFLTDNNFKFHMPLIPSFEGNLLNQVLSYRVLVSPWVEGFSQFSLSEDKEQSPETVKMGACLLAKLHNYSREYTVDNLVERDIPHCFTPFLWKKKLNDVFSKAFDDFNLGGSSQNSVKELEKIYRICLEFIKDEVEFFEDNLGEQTMIHGDFRPENIIFRRSDNPKIFDFDLCHINYSEVDVAYAALSFSGSRWFYGKRNWDLIDLFVKTYDSLSNKNLNMKILKKALIWVMLRILSTSFKQQQLKPRIELLNEIRENLAYG